MGNEQSNAPASSESGLKSQRDEDIPYTSYSISRPIDSNTPKPSASPRLDYRAKYAQQQAARKQQESPGTSSDHKIIVVAEGPGTEDESPDDELKRLENIAEFSPIIRETLNLSSVKEVSQIFDKIDSRHVMLMCIRYQEHLRHCAEAIAFDQNALCIRIKEVDFAVQTLHNIATERQKKYARHAEQMKKTQEISGVLTRVNSNIQGLVQLMDQLNNLLPPEEQMEPFVLNPPKK